MPRAARPRRRVVRPVSHRTSSLPCRVPPGGEARDWPLDWKEVADLRTAVPAWTNWAAVLGSVVLGWMGLGQLVLSRWGWDRIRAATPTRARGQALGTCSPVEGDNRTGASQRRVQVFAASPYFSRHGSRAGNERSFKTQENTGPKKTCTPR